VPFDFLTFAANGLMPLPWWGYAVFALVVTHITIASVTIFLHRAQAHRALDLHPIASHFFRFWLWLTTGMITKEWVAIHRKHHAKCETEDDPHSPQTRGIRKVFFEGTELYRAEARNTETLEKYGQGTPADWMERNVYTRFGWEGVGLMLMINLVLFGPIGATIWAVQMAWIPVTAAGVINGIGHYWGYRNFPCADASRNIVPWGIVIGGEELHNNHHAYATSAKLSSRWFEIDIGWMYIRLLAALKLARIRKVAPTLRVKRAGDAVPDLDTLQAVIANRYAIATAYARSVRQACAAELAALRARGGHFAHVPSMRRVKQWLSADHAGDLPEHERATFAQVLEHSKALTTIYAMRQELNGLWERSTESTEQLVHRLQDWCRRAEESGIPPLAQFSLQLRRYA
jgi:stearoyl-CoA desaturase (delta-9 desaturase)